MPFCQSLCLNIQLNYRSLVKNNQHNSLFFDGRNAITLYNIGFGHCKKCFTAFGTNKSTAYTAVIISIKKTFSRFSTKSVDNGENIRYNETMKEGEQP